MKINTRNLLIVCAGFTPFLTQAETDGKTTFQYEHNWKTEDRRHSDSIKLIHKKTNGWSYEVKFSTSAGGNSNYDVAYDDMQGGSGGMVIGKDFKLSKAATLTPTFEFSIGNSTMMYQSGLKYNYRINSDWSTYGRYRYEYKKPTRSSRYSTISASDKYGYAGESYLSKSDTGRHRLDAGVTYSGLDNINLTYVFNYYIGDNTTKSYKYSKGEFTEREYAVYDNGKTDYEHQFKVQYKLNKQLTPYIEYDDISQSSTSSSRQGKIKVGFNYVF
ncbi:oligogalacturonate-specific porin KdgM family protein [Pectobacterium polaris]|uniref:oligogalacturonate-specific porin KdgM family protein n=1 Tax=Pectobacterium polaris TaxID=2042057 RepID=UPI000BB30884|nr:oligogalacturonate-specific porin KdgM family protein [Pectobacterium polaris]ASY78422.1 porin [Pectobacterium polaris]